MEQVKVIIDGKVTMMPRQFARDAAEFYRHVAQGWEALGSTYRANEARQRAADFTSNNTD